LFSKRKIYFIQKDMQSRFILRFAVAVTSWAAMTMLLFAYFAGKKLDDVRYSSHIDIQSTMELLFPITFGTQAVSMLIFIGILAYAIRSLWQKLSSPLYAVKKSMEKIAGGDLTNKVVLRKKDEFQDLATDLEGMRLGLREKIDRIKQQQQAISLAANNISNAILIGESASPYIVSLQSIVVEMKAAVKAFHY
jgi:methyl-accepting chemotaxis protein